MQLKHSYILTTYLYTDNLHWLKKLNLQIRKHTELPLYAKWIPEIF